MHHPLPTSKRREAMGRWPDIYTLLTSHDNVKLVLSGHYHKVSVCWVGGGDMDGWRQKQGKGVHGVPPLCTVAQVAPKGP